MRTFVIAEAASTHEGMLNKAKRLVEVAAECGADAVKMQFCSNYQKLAEKRKTKIDYPFSIDEDWIPELKAYADRRGVEFMCSTYLLEDIAVVAPYVRRYKVSAFESHDANFIAAHGNDKDIIISNGNYLSDISLYCVSKYPCPDGELHLEKMKDTFDGISDHSKNPLTGALAVALGARYIEFHFRLADTTSRCPDFEVARTPEQAAEYIRNIRSAEVLLG